jgi:hypothetical protein
MSYELPPSRTCTWVGPEQDPRRAPLNYCGEESVTGRSYCAEHVWKVYRKGTGQGKEVAKLGKEIDRLLAKQV